MTDDQRPVEPGQMPPPPESPAGSENRRTGMAIAGRILAYVGILLIVIGIWVSILSPALARALERARIASCADNQKHIGVICKLHVNDHDRYYPELSRKVGRLMFSKPQGPSDVADYWEQMNDLGIFYCPGDDDTYETSLAVSGDDELLFDDDSYFYLGYRVTNDAEIEAFAEAYRKHIEAGEPFTDDLIVPEGQGLTGGSVISRLREGPARFAWSEGSSSSPIEQSPFPVLIERPDNHVPMGGNVSYFDGHVEFIPYPGKWPMTEKTIGILESLDALSPSR